MILVTGGAGFIGSNLVAGLLGEGVAAVAVCDRLGKSDKWRNLAKHGVDELVHPDGLSDFLRLYGARVRYVFHMGAISATTERDADLIVETNFRLSQSLWRWCAQSDIPFVYASSAATYGDGSEGFDDDGSPEGLARLRPMNAYGWSKHLFDRWVARRVVAGDPAPPQWAGLKFFNVYGPNEYHKGDMQSIVAKSFPLAAAGESVTLFRSHLPAYEDGGQTRDFVYVGDCVKVMLWLLRNREVSGLFNVGTGRGQTFRELIEALFAAVGNEPGFRWVDTPAEIRDRYQYYTQAEMGRLRSAGYSEPFADVAEGVMDYVTRYLATSDPYL
jgi:ADP-L-glycero-D-manno-heptose 6-epimerase